MDQERVDRDRLKEVHRSEQAETKVNEDFIEWLRTWGPTVLLTVLLCLTAYLLLVRWQQRAQTQQTDAWAAFAEAQSSDLPSAYESVADQYGDTGRLGVLSRLRAAHRLMRAVQSGIPIDAADVTVTDETPTLSDEERSHYLTRAEALYAQTASMDDGSYGMALHTINALNGRAAVAEARGEVEQATQYYEQAAERAEASFPMLAEQARARAASVEQYLTSVALATDDATAEAPNDDDLTPVIVEPSLRELILPNSAAAASSAPPVTPGGMPVIPPSLRGGGSSPMPVRPR